jgi:hypothetical protein
MRNAPVFACRHCCGLVFASQREIPRHRAITRAQKLRMRLGGSANLAEPFPERPRGMHRRTFYKLFNKAADAQEHPMALELKYLRRRYPEQSRGLTVVSPHARPRPAAGPSGRIGGFRECVPTPRGRDPSVNSRSRGFMPRIYLQFFIPGLGRSCCRRYWDQTAGFAP